MTDIDRRRLINPVDNGSSDNHNILPTNYDHNGQGDGSNSKKKKYFIIGGIIALLAILGLILGLTLGKNGGGDGPTPPPPPPGPIDDGYNPYHVDESSIVDTQSVKSGVIVTNDAYSGKAAKPVAKSSYEMFSRDGSKGSRRF